MHLQWSEEDLAFRDEVRAFFAEQVTPEIRRAGSLMTSVYADHVATMAWQRILHAKGWAAPSWPVEFGGCDWSFAKHYIFERERAAAGAPPLSPMGIDQVAHVVMRFGSPEKKAFYLPRILNGEHFWCQGYSEPDSGSDLASLQMQALDGGDHLVCTGSKIWTTHANVANWMFCLVRTSKEVRKQEGITFLLIDMTSTGISVKPVVMSSGEHIQNQVFFDGVRVPKANVLGEIGKGWSVAKCLLEFERGGRAQAPDMQVQLDHLARHAAARPGDDGRPLIDNPAFLSKFAALRVSVDVFEMLEFRIAAETSDGASPGAAASMLKVRATELRQQITEIGLEAAGPRGRSFQPHAASPGGPVRRPTLSAYISGEAWEAAAPLRYLNERAGSIYAGSNEIQRGILAKAVLGL